MKIFFIIDIWFLLGESVCLTHPSTFFFTTYDTLHTTWPEIVFLYDKSVQTKWREMTLKKKKMHCDNTQNDLRHWCVIHTPFGDARGLFQKTGLTNSESDTELWVDQYWDGKLRVSGSRTADLS